jgi:hypothetical protein
VTRPAPLAPGLVAAAVLARQSALAMDGESAGPTAGPHALRAHGEDCVRIATREVYEDAGDDDACAREALRERLITHAAQQVGDARRSFVWAKDHVEARLVDAAWATVLALLLGALLCVTTPAAAQDALMLARTCVSERSWATETTDCRAIAEVVRSRMDRTGHSFAASLRALAPRLHGGTITHRRWLLELDETLRRPPSLGRARWSGMRQDAWEATLEAARAILAGTIPSPCSSRPMAWGSPEDIRRRERLSGRTWVPVDCGNTVNRFGRWRWPREVDPE